MRIITGKARGVRLDTLSGLDTRPTAERTKEAVFSMLAFDIEGRRVLDLFSGSGQMGLEALSRGAFSAVFVDSSKAAIYTIEENIRSCGFKDKASVYNTDYKSFLTANKNTFDIVFLDPPYKAGLMEDAIERIAPHINENGVIVCETGSEEFLPENIEGFTSKRYKYGKIALTVYRKGE